MQVIRKIIKLYKKANCVSLFLTPDPQPPAQRYHPYSLCPAMGIRVFHLIK